MRKFIKTLALTTAAVVCAVSCNKDYFYDTTNQKTEGTTLYANTPTNVNTKVGFEDKDSEGIVISWEDGDSFKLYNSNNELVDTFTTTGDGKFTSSEVDTKLVKGEQYTAKYNEDADLLQQNGDKINNLNNACQMEAIFTYGDGKKIEFAHTMAIMTFTFKSDERPEFLLFENGEESYYIVAYSTLEPDDNDIYTSHIMINPCEATQRTLTFSLGNDGVSGFEPYYIRSVRSNKSYEAGKRYTAPISNITKWDELAAESFAKEGEISSAAELALLAKKVNEGTAYKGETFTLTEDIDLNGHEWVAIGMNHINSFQGTFNGNGHNIAGLYINQPDMYKQGLFGYTRGATIKNLSVSGYVTGRDDVGGVAGFAYENSTIINCYSNVSVRGNDNVGGVAGYVYTNCDVINCYNSGSVKGGDNADIGGVVGTANECDIINCYNSGSVEGGDNADIGGVIGYADEYSAFFYYCYYQEESGLQGIGNMTDKAPKVMPILAVEMKDASFVTRLNDNAFNKYRETACAWVTGSSGYPTLDFNKEPVKPKFSSGAGAANYPYQISCREDFDELSADVNNEISYEGNYFIMTKDIEFGGSTKRFIAIGGGSNAFKGTFDGQGYTVSELYVNDPSDNCQALFGYTYGAIVKNLSVLGEVVGNSLTAGIVGASKESLVINCHSGVKVSGNNYVGGIVGKSTESIVVNCYSSSDVNGSKYIGGVVGDNWDGSLVKNCYSSGKVSGEEYVGGVVGRVQLSEVIVCVYNTTVNSDADFVGVGSGNGETYGWSDLQMQDDYFKDTLNHYATDYNNTNPAVPACKWGWESGRYPHLTFTEITN